ncbi:MAG: hypothetical protein ACM3YM_03325 [Sphingomonadales bacterium]
MDCAASTGSNRIGVFRERVGAASRNANARSRNGGIGNDDTRIRRPPAVRLHGGDEGTGRGGGRRRLPIVRLAGLTLLAIAGLSLFYLHGLVTAPPMHEGTIGELLLSLIAVVAGMSGSAMLVIGPALFRPYQWPPPKREQP